MAAEFPAAIPTFGFTADTGKALPKDVFQQTMDEIVALATWIRGGWVAVAHFTGNFTANGLMTWTVASGDQLVFIYRLKDPFTMQVEFKLATTSVGGTPNTQLRIAIPAGKTAAYEVNARLAYANDNGTVLEARAYTSGTVIIIEKNNGANWAASTDATYIYGGVEIPITG